MFDRTGRTGTAVSGQADRFIIYRKDRTGQKSPTKSTEPDRPGPDRTGRQSPDESTGRGTGSDRTGCQFPDESTGHGTVELFTGQRTLD